MNLTSLTEYIHDFIDMLRGPSPVARYLAIGFVLVLIVAVVT